MRVSGWEGDSVVKKWADTGPFNKSNPNLFKTKRRSYIIILEFLDKQDYKMTSFNNI